MASTLSRACHKSALQAIAGASAVSATFSQMAGASPATPTATSAGKCRPIVLCGPSGAGKSTLIARLQADFPADYGFSVSHTTRAPRAGEEDGVHYHFVDKDEMEKDIKAGMFLEHAYVHGNIYGTSFEAVESVSKASKVCILDIDVQGVKTCQSVGFNADKYVFIAPPDIKALETRLRGRGTETEDRIQKRLHNAVGELEDAKSMSWDAYIVNDDISVAYEKLREVAREGRQACAESRAAATAMTAVA